MVGNLYCTRNITLHYQFLLAFSGITCNLGHLSQTCRASMKCFVPERAMVPKLLTRSALVIPMPVSMIVSVLSSLLGMTVTFNSL